MRIRLATILVHTAAKSLRLRKQLHMHFQPNHRLVIRKNLGEIKVAVAISSLILTIEAVPASSPHQSYESLN